MATPGARDGGGCDDTEALARRLECANVTVTLEPGRIRISPAIYDTRADMDLLAEVLAEYAA